MGEIARATFDLLDHVERVDEYSQDFDILFSASFPARIPQEDCRLAKMGAVNIHTGLLPKQRGYHPLNWAIVWGNEVTGITIHKVADGFDAGDVVMQTEVPIFETDTVRTLRERVEWAFPTIIAAFFVDPAKVLAQATQQNQAQATYAPRRYPSDSELNLSASPREIWNLYRSCDPDEYPAFVMVNDIPCIVRQAQFKDGRVELHLDNGQIIAR